MKALIILMAVVGLSGCGRSSVDSELIGQVKKVSKKTPLICPNRTEVDVSLGVVRNGVGSMSSQDMWLIVRDPAIEATLKAANESGAVVKLTYDTYRLLICPETHAVVTKAEILP